MKGIIFKKLTIKETSKIFGGELTPDSPMLQCQTPPVTGECQNKPDISEGTCSIDGFVK
ncbi:MAG: hypothetical protein GY757_27320 [bacterium]|nr:hypothetical protein [bacterium]